MKVRSCFVSNSSSSSFVVAGDIEDFNCKISIDICLTDYADTIIYSKEQARESFWLCDMIEMGRISSWEEVDKILDSGKIILIGSVSDEGSPKEMLLCYRGVEVTDFNGKILFSEEGY